MFQTITGWLSKTEYYDQESIQSSTTSEPRQYNGKVTKHKTSHTRQPRGKLINILQGTDKTV